MKLSISSTIKKQLKYVFTANIVVGIIAALTYPILARIFKPEILGEFQLILSVILIFSSIASFKFEEVVLLTKRKYQSKVLFQMAILSAITSSILMSVLLILFLNEILIFFKLSYFSEALWIIPIGIFSVSVFQIMQIKTVKLMGFNHFSKYKVFQSSVYNGGSALGGMLSPSLFTLLTAYCSSFLISILLMLLMFKRAGLMFFVKDFNRCKTLYFRYVKKYYKFPTINVANVFINNLSMQLPVLVLSKKYNYEVVGVYMLANRLVELPAGFITSTINTVYTKFAAEEYHKSIKNLQSVYIKSAIALSGIALIFFVTFYIISEFFLEYIYGSNIDGIGFVLICVALSKSFQILTSPLSQTANITNKQEVVAILLCVFLVLRYFALDYPGQFKNSLLAYSIVTSFFYCLILVVNYRFIRELR
ncbi:lipopolysaccharide biosynthesis protein [Parashewanella tropica]|uniref:lipopolysaccharide biosynthesis protein n=1 Tax=Parashewanella tropica TaxID=2547970 RepID=UPI00105A6D15|nr:lipopolysaccharide biosynthesis protein [Parashewanella tropica]